MLGRLACSAIVTSVVFADLVGGISGELQLLDLSPRFLPIISAVSSLSSGLSAITKLPSNWTVIPSLTNGF